MKLNIRAMAIAGAVVWGSAVGAAALINLFRPRYGAPFLQTIRSIYPGYHADRNAKDALVGTAYAALDGAAAGALIGAIYNQAAGPRREDHRLRPAA